MADESAASTEPAEYPEFTGPSTWKQKVKRFFLTGLIAMLPLLVTLYVLWVMLGVIDRTLGAWIKVGIMERLLGRDPEGLLREALVSKAFADVVATVIVIAVLLSVGFALGTFIGRKLFGAFERRVSRLPIIRIIYPLVKQVTQLFTRSKKQHFGQVVAVEYPRKGVYSIGFVTSRGLDEVRTPDGRKMVCVFLPNAPTPLTGWVLLYPEHEVVRLAMTTDEAFKLLLSGGVVVPEAGRPELDGGHSHVPPSGSQDSSSAAPSGRA